jgi:hypothetical protein
MTFVIIWKYVVRSDAAHEFRAAYDSDGDWADLFRRSPDYLGTELIAADQSTAYFTIDRWISESAADSHIESVRHEYDRLDERCAAFTKSEQLVVRGSSLTGGV